MFRAALRSVLARKVRLLLTGLAVLLGVSFMSGTYVLTDTMTAAFNDLVDTGYAQIDVLVRRENAFTAQTSSLEERASMPDSVLSTVEQVPGVARAVGDVLGYAQIVDPGTGKVIGTFGPPTAAASWNTLTGFTLEAGRAPLGDGEVVIDSGSAEANDIGVGERVQILFQGPPGEFEVVGIAGYGDGGSLFGATFALFDLPTAQRLLGKEGELDSIAVVADEGESGTALANRVTAAVPDGIEAVPASTVISEQQDQVAEGLGYLRTAFLVFAYVALFVGAFIIFNTFAIIVAQRTRELALFRALGATGRQVMSTVVAEAFIVGIVASVVPARRASRIAPIEALREAQDRPGRSLRFRLVSGAIVLAVGVGLLVYGLFGTPDNALQLVGAGVALTFIGIAMLTPLIARPVAATIGVPVRALGVPGKLARENAIRNPRRTAATASALMIGLGLVVFVAVFGASAKASTSAVLDRTLRADFILTSPTFTGFSTSAAEDVRAVPGVATVSQVRQAEAKVDGGSAFLSGIDPTTFPAVSEAGVLSGSIADLSQPNTLAVFEDHAQDNGWTVGDVVQAQFPATGDIDLEIVAIYEENGLIGDWAISLDTFDEHVVAQQLDIFVLVKVEQSTDAAAVRPDLERALEAYPNVEVQDQAEFRDQYATFLNTVLNLVTGLLLLAVFIALFGVMNTLYLSIYERTRELGLLRAVGLTRRQTRSMVRREAGIISVMGALFGVIVGIAFGWAMQQALAPEGFTELGIPGGQIAAYVIAAAVLGWLFAFLPARRAARLNVLQAIAYE